MPSQNSSTNLITCPACHHQFSLSELEKHELEKMREKMHIELEEESKKMRKRLEEEEKKKAFAWAKDEISKSEQVANERLKKQEQELAFLKKRDEEAQKKEETFIKQEYEFEKLKKSLELEKERARIEERKRLEEEYSKEAKEKLAIEQEKMQREMEKQLRNKDEQIIQMQRSIDDAKRKGAQGSMQVQGEMQEEALKEMLRSSFPYDILEDVEKGIKGADIIQQVYNHIGNAVGIIAWESKNTKAWSDLWIEKMKEDRLRVNATTSIIVSNVLPEGIKHFGLYKGIWVTGYTTILPLTTALRENMIELAKVKNSLQGKDEKMDALYHYLISPEFQAKIENILEAFLQLQQGLEREKRAMEKIWSAREKQLGRVIKNTSGFYGEMQGLIGSELPTVKYLELESGEEEDVEDENPEKSLPF